VEYDHYIKLYHKIYSLSGIRNEMEVLEWIRYDVWYVGR